MYVRIRDYPFLANTAHSTSSLGTLFYPVTKSGCGDGKQKVKNKKKPPSPPTGLNCFRTSHHLTSKCKQTTSYSTFHSSIVFLDLSQKWTSPTKSRLPDRSSTPFASFLLALLYASEIFMEDAPSGANTEYIVINEEIDFKQTGQGIAPVRTFYH